jgi:hypothetical protein
MGIEDRGYKRQPWSRVKKITVRVDSFPFTFDYDTVTGQVTAPGLTPFTAENEDVARREVRAALRDS